MEIFTDYRTGHAEAVLNAALDRASKTQFQVREKTLLALLAKLEQRLWKQKPSDRSPISPEQIDTISFMVGANRCSMRQQG